MKHIVCFSGGEGSALTAAEVVRRYGAKNTILINHDLSNRSELMDVKRYKKDVSSFLGVPITYVNFENWSTKDQFDVCLDLKTFVNPSNRSVLCTYKLKTEPFYKWLNKNYNSGDVIYYGFDGSERSRITRRSAFLGNDGYKSDYPLALWQDRTFFKSSDMGVSAPMQYSVFKHANCIGCLKAGWQHWYVIYCLYPHVWEKAKQTEEKIGYSIHNDFFLEEKEYIFSRMRYLNVEPTEKINSSKFWSDAKKRLKTGQIGLFDLLSLPDIESDIECITDCGIDRV